MPLGPPPPRRPGESYQEWMDRHDPTFKDDLRKSQKYVDLSIRILRSIGLFAYDPGIYQRPGGGVSDLHDIHFGHLWVCRAAESKSRASFDFDSLPDFTTRGGKYPKGTYATVIVDTVNHLKVKLRELRSFPEFYWIWSKDESGCLQIDCRQTLKMWFGEHHDSTLAGRDKGHIMCPLFEYYGRVVEESDDLVGIFKRLDPDGFLNKMVILRPVKGIAYRTRIEFDNLALEREKDLKKIGDQLDDLKWLKTETDEDGNKTTEWSETDPGPPKPREKAGLFG